MDPTAATIMYYRIQLTNVEADNILYLIYVKFSLIIDKFTLVI